MDEQLQEQVIQLIQAAQQGDQEAQQTIQRIMQAAQQGDQQALQIAQMIQTEVEQMQDQTMQDRAMQKAKFGAKLNYIRSLRGLCPEGYEMQYFKKGGQLCKKCVAKQNKNKEKLEEGGTSPVDAFKCGRKMKKVKKAGGGTTVPEALPLVKETVTKYPGEPYMQKITRIWSDGTTSKMETDEGGITYTGRKGEVGVTNVPNARQNEIADSLQRVDWSKKLVPTLNSKLFRKNK